MTRPFCLSGGVLGLEAVGSLKYGSRHDGAAHKPHTNSESPAPFSSPLSPRHSSSNRLMPLDFS